MGAVALGCPEAPSPEGAGSVLSSPAAATIPESEFRPGGETSVARSGAFETPIANMPSGGLSKFNTGDIFFRSPQVDRGPHFSTDNCRACHVSDGRGNPPPSPASPMRSMVLKVAAPDGADGFGPDPIYGGQIQVEGVDRGAVGSGCPEDGLSLHDGALVPASCGAIGEAYPYVLYEDEDGRYPDGSEYTLKRPVYVVTDASYGAFAEGVRFSPRVAPGMPGMGLLGAITEDDLRALADPFDLDGDGISGRIHWVRDVLKDELAIGRYGWKAINPTVLQQSAGAFRGDIGVTSSLFPEESCTDAQVACLDAAVDEEKSSPETDVTDVFLAFVEFYSRTLGVPERAGFDPATGTWDQGIAAGWQHFRDVGCDSCHAASFVTGEAEGSPLGDIVVSTLVQPAEPIEALSGQQIHPYTDLLLHDMGGSCEPVVRETEAGVPCVGGADCNWVVRCDGLADGFAEGDASGSEWRTPPLWGIGLAQEVNERARFLHDGRAETLEEAILWHGGEAQAARDAFMALELGDRLDLIEFLESL